MYKATIQVVASVRELSEGVPQCPPSHYLSLVQKVGQQLRALLGAVDELIPSVPRAAHREIELAHRVLAKDMADLVDCFKLVHKYAHTTLHGQYTKQLLGAGHVLAMDSKNLLDVIDGVRLRHQLIPAASTAAATPPPGGAGGGV